MKNKGADNFEEYKRLMEAQGKSIIMQPIQLTPGRYPLSKPYPDQWSIARCINEACREGMILLASEAKAAKEPPPAPPVSVTPDPNAAAQDALDAKSTNPYRRARAQIRAKMTPKARAMIDAMEAGTMEKDDLYEKFNLQIAKLGDTLSANN